MHFNHTFKLPSCFFSWMSFGDNFSASILHLGFECFFCLCLILFILGNVLFILFCSLIRVFAFRLLSADYQSEESHWLIANIFCNYLCLSNIIGIETTFMVVLNFSLINVFLICWDIAAQKSKVGINKEDLKHFVYKCE